jgi:Mg2+ and Co2+ transporter CorA
MSDSRDVAASDVTVKLTVRPRPLSALQRMRQQRLWWWLGYPLVALMGVAYLYLLRSRETDAVHAMLKLHNVELIHRPDGTAALNGAKDDTEAFERSYRRMHRRHVQYRWIAYALLALAMIAYSGFLLR